MRKLLTAAAALLVAGSIAVTGPAAHAATVTSASTCTGTVQISSLTFSPAQASPGQTATVTVVAQNCTTQPQQVSFMFTARFVGASTGIPAGCPAIDPLPPQQATIPAGGTFTNALSYPVFSGCTATALQVTARFTDTTGTVLATQTASLPIAPATSCAVSYRSSSQWRGGFVAQVSITNTGTATVTGWTLAFTYPGDQHITSAWNAVVHQSGAAVTATDAGYNATIAAGGTVTFGVQGSWQSSAAAPTAFTLNGAPCQVR